MRPAFYGEDVSVGVAKLIQTVLHYCIVSIGRMRSAMSHDQNSIFFAEFRELSRNCFHGFGNIVSLAFLTLPVHQRSTEGHFLEVVFVQVINCIFVCIFHARNNIQRGQSNTGVTFSFQLSQSLFRCRDGETFMSFDTVNNNMRGESGNYFYTGMSSFNRVYSCFNSFSTAVFKGSTEAHYNDSVFVRQVCQSRINIGFYADLGCHKQSRGSVFNFVVQLVCGMAGSSKA